MTIELRIVAARLGASYCYFLQYPIDKILLLMSSFAGTRKTNQMRAAFRRTIFAEFPFNFDLFFPCLFTTLPASKSNTFGQRLATVHV
jgi:hypothetical protein